MELPRRKLLVILTCPLPLIVYLLCLLITYQLVVPNQETGSNGHIDDVNNTKLQNISQTSNHKRYKMEKYSMIKNGSNLYDYFKTITNYSPSSKFNSTKILIRQTPTTIKLKLS